jgi:hypothetical protein
MVEKEKKRKQKKKVAAGGGAGAARAGNVNVRVNIGNPGPGRRVNTRGLLGDIAGMPRGGYPARGVFTGGGMSFNLQMPPPMYHPPTGHQAPPVTISAAPPSFTTPLQVMQPQFASAAITSAATQQNIARALTYAENTPIRSTPLTDVSMSSQPETEPPTRRFDATMNPTPEIKRDSPVVSPIRAAAPGTADDESSFSLEILPPTPPAPGITVSDLTRMSENEWHTQEAASRPSSGGIQMSGMKGPAQRVSASVSAVDLPSFSSLHETEAKADTSGSVYQGDLPSFSSLADTVLTQRVDTTASPETPAGPSRPGPSKPVHTPPTVPPSAEHVRKAARPNYEEEEAFLRSVSTLKKDQLKNLLRDLGQSPGKKKSTELMSAITTVYFKDPGSARKSLYRFLH